MDPLTIMMLTNMMSSQNNEDGTKGTTTISPNMQLYTAGAGIAGDLLSTITDRHIREANPNNPFVQNAASGSSWGDVFNTGNKKTAALSNITNSTIDYTGNKNNDNLLNTWDSNDLQDDINKASGWDRAGSMLGSTLSDAATGAAIGSAVPIIGTALGAGIGALSGLGRGIVSWVTGANAEEDIQRTIAKANKEQVDNYYTTAQNNQRRQQRQAMMNYFAEGGSLEDLNGVTTINAGSTHEQNPYGGVKMGIASDGLDNLVEEGEIVYDDYVYSNRLKPTKTLIKDNNLPEKYFGLTYAKLAEKLQKESEDRPNDPISKQTLEDWMSRLANAQETQKMQIQQRELAKALDSLPVEDKAMLMNTLMQQQEGIDLSQPMYAEGGKIHIKPSKRGTFTAAATKHGKSVQEFASQVLAHPENYSPAMRKKANFARNSAHWHADGGWNTQAELNDYYAKQFANFWNNLQGKKGSNINKAYLTGTQARQWVNQLSAGDEQQKALAAMLKNQWGDNLDWSENATWEFKNRFNPRGTVTESQAYLDWAKDNPTMRDAMWGIKHIPQLSVDNRYHIPNYVQINEDGTFTTLTAPGFEERIVAGNVSQYPQGFTPEEGKNYKFYYPELADETLSLGNPSNIVDDESKYYGPVIDENRISSNLDNLLKVAPYGLGALVSALQPVDYTYANKLQNLASRVNPIAASPISGYRRYNPYDINLGDAENISLEVTALNANRGQNRATQGALNIGTINANQKAKAQRNLAWQQANEADRLSTDTYNLGIDKFNSELTKAYDQFNTQRLAQRLALEQASAQAADASKTAWAKNISDTATNFLNQLGNIGKENWANNQALIGLAMLDHADLIKVFGSEQQANQIEAYLKQVGIK